MIRKVRSEVVDGLNPDTRYYYRLRYRNSGSTDAFLARCRYAMIALAADRDRLLSRTGFPLLQFSVSC